MKSTQHIVKYLALYSAVVLMAACANPMQPAKNALDNINATLASVSPDAQKYIPDQLASVQANVAALAASFDKKDYTAVIAGAPAVLTEVNGLAAAAATKKDEVLKALGDEWRSLVAFVPQAVTAVQTRIDALSKSRHVPKDIDLSAAKTGLSDATSAWEKAQSDFKSGNASDAVTAAQDAKSKLDSAAAALKLNLTQAAS